MIKFLGHASYYIEYDGVSLVTDPWFSKTGAFLGAWHQFPDNSNINFSWMNDLDYVCITHEHADHFDLDWLSQLNKKTKIIVPKYEDRYLTVMLNKNLPNEVIEVPTRTKYKINEKITICPVIQSVPIWDDCSYIFETPLGTFLNLNDMKPSNDDLNWIKDNFDIDYLAMQYSGANWHPIVYNYTDEQKIKIAKKKIKLKYDNVLRLFESVGAKKLLPMAGPACFLSEDLYHLNFAKYSIFPAQDHFYKYAKLKGYENETIILLPEDELSACNKCLKKLTQKNLLNECFTDKKNYLEQYKNDRIDIINTYLNSIKIPDYELFNLVKERFVPFIRKNKFYRDQIDGKILLHITGPITEYIIIDFTDPINPVKQFNGESHICQFEIESKYLNMILTHELTWEELFLSLRFQAHRWPDEYNEALVVFLRFMRKYSEAAIIQYERYETSKMLSETFDIEHNNKKYTLQRYCPHALGDLSKGEIIDNHVVCPLHGWEFHLDTGQCRNKKKYSIRTENNEEECSLVDRS
jgi:UDP-MurNAc hydroxylase